jgi:LysR family hydrogen peroxide-inducible transcriptional activator
MTLIELRYVIALAETKHFGQASAKCNVSQPTLSIAIKNKKLRWVFKFLKEQ